MINKFPTIHLQTQCGLQIQNTINKLINFVLQAENTSDKQVHYLFLINDASETNSLPHFIQVQKINPKSTRKMCPRCIKKWILHLQKCISGRTKNDKYDTKRSRDFCHKYSTVGHAKDLAWIQLNMTVTAVKHSQTKHVEILWKKKTGIQAIIV